MNSKELTTGILKAVSIIAGVLVSLYFLYLVRSVILYICLASILALIGAPIVSFLRKKLKFGNTLAVTATIVFFLGSFISVSLMFIPLLIQQSRNLSLLDINALRNKITELYGQFTQFIMGQVDPKALDNGGLLSQIDFSFIPDFFNTIGGALGSFTTGLFAVLFIAFFLLRDSKLMENVMVTLVADNEESKLRKSIYKIRHLLSRYFLGLVLQIFILFVIYTVVLITFGVDNPVAIAFICALFNLIPYVGPLISGALMVLLTMTSHLGEGFMEVILPKAFYVLLGFLFGQLVDNLFSQPFIFSSSVNSHPLEIFLVIIIAGLLFGIIGMVAAVPAYTVVKVTLKEFMPDNKIVKALTKNL